MRKMSLRKVYKSALKEGSSPEENKKKGKMIAIPVPLDVSNYLQDKFADAEGNMVMPEDMHLTLGLVRSENDNMVLNVLRDISTSFSPFNMTIDSFDTFPPSESSDNKHVLIAKPHADEISGLHDLVFSTFKKAGLEIDNGSFEFSPHITIKYCDELPNLAQKELKDPIDFIVDKLQFASKGNKKEVYLRDRE